MTDPHFMPDSVMLKVMNARCAIGVNGPFDELGLKSASEAEVVVLELETRAHSDDRITHTYVLTDHDAGEVISALTKGREMLAAARRGELNYDDPME